jgi:predicted acetyltransferase
MKCENCKYWAKGGDEDYIKLIDAGICNKARMFWDSTEWSENKETNVTERTVIKEYKNNGVFVQDGSDYRASMITQPDFGCVKFEVLDA